MMTKQYQSMNVRNRTEIIYCFDCDDFDIKPEDKKFLDKARQFCEDHNAHFLWFCKDIESVYIGRKISKNKKKAEAENFKRKRMIRKINQSNLISDNYRINHSNIFNVLDKFMKRY